MPVATLSQRLRLPCQVRWPSLPRSGTSALRNDGRLGLRDRNYPGFDADADVDTNAMPNPSSSSDEPDRQCRNDGLTCGPTITVIIAHLSSTTHQPTRSAMGNPSLRPATVVSPFLYPQAAHELRTNYTHGTALLSLCDMSRPRAWTPARPLEVGRDRRFPAWLQHDVIDVLRSSRRLSPLDYIMDPRSTLAASLRSSAKGNRSRRHGNSLECCGLGIGANGACARPWSGWPRPSRCRPHRPPSASATWTWVYSMP